jgi:hypothetical protein
MLYAILAYHEEQLITAMTPEEDAALMTQLHTIHDPLIAEGRMGPAARLDVTGAAFTLRGGRGGDAVIDGPFAETKEQLLGIYMVDCADAEAAIKIARDLRAVNPTAVYEIRPIALYLPGAPIAG